MKTIEQILSSKDHTHTVETEMGGGTLVKQLITKVDATKAMQEYADEVLKELANRCNSKDHGEYLESATIRFRNELDFSNDTAHVTHYFIPKEVEFMKTHNPDEKDKEIAKLRLEILNLKDLMSNLSNKSSSFHFTDPTPKSNEIPDKISSDANYRKITDTFFGALLLTIAVFVAIFSENGSVMQIRIQFLVSSLLVAVGVILIVIGSNHKK